MTFAFRVSVLLTICAALGIFAYYSYLVTNAVIILWIYLITFLSVQKFIEMDLLLLPGILVKLKNDIF